MTDQLPWDTYAPAEPAEPEPYVPPAPARPDPPPIRPPAPARPPSEVDVKALASDLLNEAMSYAKATIEAIGHGEAVDLARPTITAETAAGRELVVADARNRSWRTFIQGLAFDLFAGLVAAVATLSGLDPFVKETWLAFGILVLKTFVSAGISYVMRLKATPTIRTRGPELALLPLPQRIPEDEAGA